jgi:translation initiation factor IF-3
MPPSQALMLAEEKGLDLVEIAASASPPVCRIMNSGKFFYQQSKRESEARKHQRHIQVKEVKFRPKIDEHDFQFKLRNAERFLSGGNKVKSVVIYRGREVVHMEVGRRHLERLASELSEVCNVESPPKREGNTMVQILAPKKDRKAPTKTKKKEGADAKGKEGDGSAAGKKVAAAAKKGAAAKKKSAKTSATGPARVKTKKKEAGSPAATAAGKAE